MITALLLMYFFGGGVTGGILNTESVKQMTLQVEAVIEDTQRLKTAKKTLKQLRRESRLFERSFSRSGRQLTKLYMDHAASGEQMREVLDKLNSDWGSSQQKAVELRWGLKDSLTESEWALVFDSK